MKMIGSWERVFSGRNQPPTWCSPPARLTLADNEVHLWRASLSFNQNELTKLQLILFREEKHRVASLRIQKDKHAFILRRAKLRIILARYLGVDPNEVQFVYGIHGKPALGGDFRDLTFSSSHSQELALIAVAHNELGVDIERVLPYFEWKITSKAFCPNEWKILTTLTASARNESCYTL